MHTYMYFLKYYFKELWLLSKNNLTRMISFKITQFFCVFNANSFPFCFLQGHILKICDKSKRKVKWDVGLTGYSFSTILSCYMYSLYILI